VDTAERSSSPARRPYTGFDGPNTGMTGGLAQWIIEARRTSQGVLWNNGSWGARDQRGRPGVPSVHQTGRAVDLSWRRYQGKGVVRGRPRAVEWIDRVIAANDVLDVDCVLDYFPTPYGRGWRCDRQRWINYTQKQIHGAPGGDWFHVEIGLRLAHDAAGVRAAFRQVFPDIPH